MRRTSELDPNRPCLRPWRLTHCTFLLFLSACLPGGNSGDEVDGFFDTGSVIGEIGNSAIVFSPPDSKNLGQAEVGSGSTSGTILATNNVNYDLLLSRISISEDSFSVQSHTCPLAPESLQPGESCSVTVRFTPKSPGVLGATLRMRYALEEKGPSFVSTVGVSGTGVADLTFTGLQGIDQVYATQLRLNWTHDPAASNYFVFRILGDGSPVLLDTLSAPVSNYTVSGLTPSTSYRFRVRAQDFRGVLETNENDRTVTTDSPPVLTALSDLNFPLSFKEAGDLVDVDVNNVNGGGAGNDTEMSYTCVFDRRADGTVNPGTDCASLPGTVDLTGMAAQGKLSWTPDADAYGAYEIKLTGTYTGVSDDEIFIVDVRQNYDRTHLAIDLDAQFADLTRPGINPLALWDSILDAVVQGVLHNFDFTAGSGWTGDGTASLPYALAFDGVDDYADAGAALSAATQLFVAAWVKPEDVARPGATLLGNGAGTGNGFRIRQSDTGSGAIELAIGHVTAVSDQSTVILADSPLAYWKLGETGTASNSGSIGTAVKGSYSGGYSTVAGLAHGSSSATEFNGGYVGVPDHSLINSGGPYTERSIELWFRANQVTGTQILYKEGGSGNGFAIYLDGSTLYCQAWSTAQGWGGPANPGGTKYHSAPIASGTAYHVVLTFSSTDDRLRCYLNGVGMGPDIGGLGPMNSHTDNIAIGGSTDSWHNHSGAQGSGFRFNGTLDEIAVFGYELSAAEVASHFNPVQPSCSSIVPLTNQKWRLVGASYNGSLARLYMNGSQVCSFQTAAGLDPAATTLQLGRDPGAGGDYWPGEIAHVVAYHQAPTGDSAADMDALYRATVNRFGRDYVDVILADNPIGFWRMDAVNPETNVGSLGNALNATYAGGYMTAPTLVNGDGNATQMDGTSGRMSIPNHSAINSGGPYTERSIELWFQSIAPGGIQVLYEEGGTSNGFGIYLDGGTLYCQAWGGSTGWGTTGTGGTKYLSSAVSAGNIYHVALTFNSVADRLRCYLNGSLLGTVSGIGEMAAHTGGISVGNSVDGAYYHSGTLGAGYHFNGIIDEVAIYDFELTGPQVQDHYLP